MSAAFLVSNSPELAGAAWLRLERLRARGCVPGRGLEIKACGWALAEEHALRMTVGYLPADTLDALPAPEDDSAREEERLDMLRLIAAALAKAHPCYRRNWESLLASVRAGGPRALTKHQLYRLRAEIRRRLRLA